MKRVVSLFLLFVLVACGSNQEETSVNDVITTTTTSSAPSTTSDNSNVSTTTTSYASTGLTCSITPSSTSSKVLVIVNVVGLYKTGADTAVALKITDGTNSYEFDTAVAYDGTTGGNAVGGSSYSRLWTPSSTNQQTYTLQFANAGGSGSAFINARWSSSFAGTRSTITAMEIAQ